MKETTIINLKKNKGKIIGGLALILFCLFYCWKALDYKIHDFGNYYFGAYSIVNDFFSKQIYDAFYFNQKMTSEGFSGIFLSFYPNTPFLAFLFTPFTLIPVIEAKLVFNLLGTALFVFALFRLMSWYKVPLYFLPLVLLLFLVPLKNNILFGQPYFYLFFLLAEGLLLYEKGKTGLACFCWALVLLLKIFPVLFFIWFVIKKDKKAFFYLGFFCVLLIGISLPFCGIEIWQYFVESVFFKSSSGIIYDGFSPKAKSALMLFKNMFVKDPILNPQPFIESAFLFQLVQVLFKGTLLSGCVVLSFKYKKELLVPFSIWMMASLLIGPTNSSYSKLFLIFPLLALLTQKNIKTHLTGLSLILIFLVANLPMHFFYDLPLLFKFPRLYFLMIFFILFYKINKGEQGERDITKRKKLLTSVFFLTLFGILALFSSGKQAVNSSKVLLEEPPPAIITGFASKDGKLIYNYFNVEGLKEKKTSYLIETIDAQNLEIVENQVHYKGRPITQNKANKRHPRLVNGKEVFYLSDLNRGTGFYTLRKVEIDKEN